MSDVNAKPSSLNIIILCGGSGKRLYPLSTEDMPKQFLKIIPYNNTHISLLEKTIIRLLNIPHKAIYCCTDVKYFHFFKPLIEKYNIQLICEPSKRGTTSAVCLSTLSIHHNDAVL